MSIVNCIKVISLTFYTVHICRLETFSTVLSHFPEDLQIISITNLSLYQNVYIIYIPSIGKNVCIFLYFNLDVFKVKNFFALNPPFYPLNTCNISLKKKVFMQVCLCCCLASSFF